MKPTTAFRELFRYLGLASLVVALFLVFAVFAIAMRPLMFVVAFIAALVGLVLYRFSPRFRGWFKAVGEERIS